MIHTCNRRVVYEHTFFLYFYKLCQNNATMPEQLNVEILCLGKDGLKEASTKWSALPSSQKVKYQQQAKQLKGTLPEDDAGKQALANSIWGQIQSQVCGK